MTRKEMITMKFKRLVAALLSATLMISLSACSGNEKPAESQTGEGTTAEASMTQVAGLVKELASMGKIIFIVTHDYEFVCRTCTRVLHVDHGEQCEDILVSPTKEKEMKKLFSIQ